MKQAEWRQLKRQQRKALTITEKAQASQQIAETFLRSKAYQNANHLAVYLALPEEVNTRTIIETAWADRKPVYLPVVTAKGQAMQFAPYCHNSVLIKDAVKMSVPDCDTSQYIPIDTLDTVIVPLVAFDDKANRIGMGGGFYDRTFAYQHDNTNSTPQLIGIAFDIQRTDAPITTADWDIPLHRIITEKSIYPL